MKQLQIDFASAVSQFEKAIKEFRVRSVIYQTVFRGKGLEFEGYRNFESDEDVSMLDANASRRAGKLLAKQYIEERNVDIIFLVDVSSSMLFGSGKKLKAEYSAELILALGHLIINSNDNVGLVMFSDKIVKYIPPSRSKNQFYLLVKYLSDINLYGGKRDFGNSLDYALRNIKSRSSVIILVSDFLHIDEKNERDLRLLGTKFETLAVMVRDPLDNSLPNVKAEIVLQDPYSNSQISIDPSITSEIYNESSLKQKIFVNNMLKDSGIDVLELMDNKDFVLPVVSFLKSRAGGAK
jgi:uncharacterized protein (DUF58 family)